MLWQDIFFTISSVALSLALIPSIFRKDKPAFITSLFSGLIFLFNSLIFASLGLLLTSITVFIKSVLWLTLAGQKYRLGHHKIPGKK